MLQSSKITPKVINVLFKATSKCTVNIAPDCRDPVLFSICLFENARTSSPIMLFVSIGLHISKMLLFLIWRQSHAIVKQEGFITFLGARILYLELNQVVLHLIS